jgi:hypothetical protein
MVDTAQTEIVESSSVAAPDDTGGVSVRRTATRRSVGYQPGGVEMSRRVLTLVFGLIQIVIGLRLVLLLLDAREANGIVSGILNISQLFVGPFAGSSRPMRSMRMVRTSTWRPSWP